MPGLIIGLTGAFGSGCSFLAENFLKEFEQFSLSKILKEAYLQEKGVEADQRELLQEFGDEIRDQDRGGASDKLAQMLFENMKDPTTQTVDVTNRNIVIDSIRNPAEIQFFREKWPNFILMAVFADKAKRWGRVNEKYNDSHDTFNRDDQRDSGYGEPEHGQQVKKCFFQADIVIANNEEINPRSEKQNAYIGMRSKIEDCLSALTDPLHSSPTAEEIAMAVAYTVGRNSKCKQRKVGAVIVDAEHNILSSGFNHVPPGLEDCESKYGYCYRKWYREKDLTKRFKKLLENDISPDRIDGISLAMANSVKMLELCRSMHAEENAIMNMVGRSSSIGIAKRETEDKPENGLKAPKCVTLFATTYPCNLCANKIVKSGIKKVVYFEPYPVEEAKQILEKGQVISIPFEGVTFRAFFKAYQYWS